MTNWGENQTEFSTVEKEHILLHQKKKYQNMLNLIMIIFAILLIFTLQFVARRDLVGIELWNGTPNNFCTISEGRLQLLEKNNP